MAKRSERSVSQRLEAVLSLLRHEDSAVRIAQRVGVSEPTLYRWRSDFLAGGEAALLGSKGNGPQQRIQELEREIEKRDQVIGELTIANRFLRQVSGHSQ